MARPSGWRDRDRQPFVISATGTQLYTKIAPSDPAMADYLTAIEDPESNKVYHITHVALAEGVSRLSERRVILNPSHVCLVK